MTESKVYTIAKKLIVYFIASVVLFYIAILIHAGYNYIIAPKTVHEAMVRRYESLLKPDLKDSVHEKKVVNNLNYIKMMHTNNGDTADFYFGRLLKSLDSTDFKRKY